MGPMIGTDDLGYCRDWETEVSRCNESTLRFAYRTCGATKTSTRAPLQPISNLWSDVLQRAQVPSYLPPNSTSPEGFSSPLIRIESSRETGSVETYKFRKNVI